MRRLLVAAFAVITLALPDCTVAAVAPPPIALAPGWWRPALSCPDPVTRTVRVTTRRRWHGHIVTRVRLQRRVIACYRYHPPSVVLDER